MKKPNYLGAVPLAVGIALIAAYNRGDLPAILADFSVWGTVQIVVGMAAFFGAIHYVVKLSYWIFPPRVD